jgi:hypothetical protein
MLRLSLATVPATAGPYLNGYLLQVITNPGATAPTDDYDITLTTSDGIDAARGLLANRDTSTTEVVDVNYPLKSTLTLNLSNNSVNSAVGTVTLVLWVNEGPPVSELSIDDGGNNISIDDGGNNISIDDGGNTITTEDLGFAMTTICNSAAGDWEYAPSAGKQFWIYHVKYSVDTDCADNTRTDVECSGSSANITSDEEPNQGGSYGINMTPNYINCGTDTAISIDHCDANNVNLCWTYREITP